MDTLNNKLILCRAVRGQYMGHTTWNVSTSIFSFPCVFVVLIVVNYSSSISCIDGTGATLAAKLFSSKKVEETDR